MDRAESISVSVKLCNSGTMASGHTVQLFVTQQYRYYYAPEVRLLKGFAKFHLDPLGCTTASFKLSCDELSYVPPSSIQRYCEAGSYLVSVGGLQRYFNVTGSSAFVNVNM